MFHVRPGAAPWINGHAGELPLKLEATYKQVAGPPPPDFGPYKLRVESDLRNLIDSECSEKDLQAFLEKHPCLIPGAWTPGTKSGHYPLHQAVITQPSLNGAECKRPDFMWLSTHSGAWYAALVEIERPSKHIFNQDGTPSSQFCQARNQLAEWRTWFNDPTNVSLFVEDYGVPDTWRRMRQQDLHLILIFGRRREFEGNPRLSRHRGSLLTGPNEELMSFDRLEANASLCDAITVRLAGKGQYRVLHVPETFALTPHRAEDLLPIEGWEGAIDANPAIADKRKEFLKQRIAYWKHWAENDNNRFFDGRSSRE